MTAKMNLIKLAKKLTKALSGFPQSEIENREFIAYENKDKEQIYRLELSQFENDEITTIIRKINYWKSVEIIKSPAYKNFATGYYDFGRLRIGDFRIFVHRENSKKWIMLHVFRKTSDKNPESETLKAINRLKEYKSR